MNRRTIPFLVEAVGSAELDRCDNAAYTVWAGWEEELKSKREKKNRIFQKEKTKVAK